MIFPELPSQNNHSDRKDLKEFASDYSSEQLTVRKHVAFLLALENNEYRGLIGKERDMRNSTKYLSQGNPENIGIPDEWETLWNEVETELSQEHVNDHTVVSNRDIATTIRLRFYDKLEELNKYEAEASKLVDKVVESAVGKLSQDTRDLGVPPDFIHQFVEANFMGLTNVNSVRHLEVYLSSTFNVKNGAIAWLYGWLQYTGDLKNKLRYEFIKFQAESKQK